MGPPIESRLGPRASGLQGLQALGMARRAGRLVLGSRAVRDAARAGSLAVVLIARDASGNARQRVLPLLQATGVPLVECVDRAQLGAAVGRGAVAVVGISDRGLADMVVAGLRRGGGPKARSSKPR